MCNPLSHSWLYWISHISLEFFNNQVISIESHDQQFTSSHKFHSNSCSMVIRRVQIWSTHDLSCLKLACWSHKKASTPVFILSKSTLFKTFPRTNTGVIPLWLLHAPRSPFIGTFTINPSLPSTGILFSSHILAKNPWRISTDVSRPAYSYRVVVVSHSSRPEQPSRSKIYWVYL